MMKLVRNWFVIADYS